MCEVCRWYAEDGTTGPFMQMKYLKMNREDHNISEHASPHFEIKYCPKCGRRLNKGGKKNEISGKLV